MNKEKIVASRRDGRQLPSPRSRRELGELFPFIVDEHKLTQEWEIYKSLFELYYVTLLEQAHELQDGYPPEYGAFFVTYVPEEVDRLVTAHPEEALAVAIWVSWQENPTNIPKIRTDYGLVDHAMFTVRRT